MSVVPGEASKVAGDARVEVGRDASGSRKRESLLPRSAEAAPHAEGDRSAGKYRIISLLGRGGMGDVWLAHNETLDIEVALNLMRKEADGREAGSRFMRE